MPPIVPYLWFATEALEAAELYCEVFPESRIRSVARYDEGGPGPVGEVMVVDFEIDGRRMAALNGRASGAFTEAVSFQILCETQEQVDHYWDRLGAGGEHLACGWLRDRFGVAWQVTPARLLELIQDPDPARARRVMAAMLTMGRLDLAVLQAAADGEPVAG
ncbi:MAG: VOC family protein [Thermoleophilia bacterium]|nr:VOC family protein [Thermoleophilia bacterium]